MIRRKIDAIPISVIILVSFFDFYLFFTVKNPMYIIPYFLLMIFPKTTVSGWAHHMAHCRPFKNNKIHLGFEFLVGLQVGILPNCWMLHHNVGHHGNLLDQEKDASAWKRNGRTMGVVEYCLYNSLMTYPRSLSIAKEKSQRVYHTTIFFIVLTLVTLSVLFYINPINAFLCFLLPMIVSLYMTFLATYDHHTGIETQNIFESCRNNLHPFYNLITGNLGYHTAHHYKQGVHWSEVPKLHKEIEHLIPDHLINRTEIFKYGRD